MSKQRSSRKRIKKSTKRNLIATIVIVVVAFVGFFYIKDVEWKEEQKAKASRSSNELYKTLENNDSIRYLENIELGKNTNILLLSKLFYKDEIFWPYIFKENNKIENPLDIPKGTLIRIPRVNPKLLDTSSEENIERVKFVGDSILRVIQESQKPRLVN